MLMVRLVTLISVADYACFVDVWVDSGDEMYQKNAVLYANFDWFKFDWFGRCGGSST